MSISTQVKEVKLLQTKLWISYLLYRNRINKTQLLEAVREVFRKSMIDSWYKGTSIAIEKSVKDMETFYPVSDGPYRLALILLMQSGSLTEKAALKKLKCYRASKEDRLFDLRLPPINSFDYGVLEDVTEIPVTYELCLAARGDIHALTICLALALVSEHTKSFVDQIAAYEGLCWALPPVLALPWIWPHRDSFVQCVFDALSIEEATGGIFFDAVRWNNIDYHALKFRRYPVSYRKQWHKILISSGSASRPTFVRPTVSYD